MINQNLGPLIPKILTEIENLIPRYMQNPLDKPISNGNVAICIIEDDGVIHGRIYGSDKPRGRNSYRIAWTKASQAWLTGVKTGDYEKMVFNGEIPENANGIDNPDLIGWVGGQPVTLLSGEKLSVGFSGFRGVTDLEIVIEALRNLKLY
jgi:uncharacterized protein GlcG (DUF336 family)